MEPSAAIVGAIAGAIAATLGVVLVRARRAPATGIQEADPLTGLPTHHVLMQRLRDARGDRDAILYLDLDHFELFNERLGRTAGDRVLSTVADILRSSCGEHLLARIGGDEFAVYARDVQPAEATVVAERLRRAIAGLRTSDLQVMVDASVSVGIAMLDRTITPQEALRRASAACRNAKAQGGDRIELYRPALGEEARHAADARWSVALREAIRDHRIELVFQPIAGVNDLRVSHYEALVRVQASDGTSIPASSFIPTAERCGLIADLDRTVVRIAVQRMAAETAEGHPFSCAINLSGLSLHEDAVVSYIRDEIEASGIDPSRIVFEITETAAIANLTQARRSIEALRSIGCRFALDDFGKGLSSLTYLRHLPVDYLKIDGAFVRDIATDHVNQEMVRSINGLAHSLGIRTIAECVENDAGLRTLSALGVDFAQGYYVGQPSVLVRSTIVIPDESRERGLRFAIRPKVAPA